MSNYEKLHEFQEALMLDFLGVPLAEQSKSIKEKRKMLAAFQASNPEWYTESYNHVVLREKDSSKVVQHVINAEDAAQLITDHCRGLEYSAVENIESQLTATVQRREKELLDTQKDFVGAVKQKFEAAVEREAKKHNILEIKFSDCEPQKISGVVHEDFARMCQLGKARKNILLVGPSGCGKTHVAKQLAHALGLDFGSQSCSAGVSESVFSGWLLPTGDDGRFDYVMSKFIEIYENGGVFLFDEMDNSDANVLVFLNQALANGSFYLPQRYNNQKVVRHQDFVAVGAANTFGGGADAMYHGRIALDAATLDRFRLGTIFMDYSPAIEAQLIDSEVLNWGIKIRAAIKKHNLNRLMSTRTMIDASDMKKACGWTLADWDQGYFADWSREELAVTGFKNRGAK